MTSYVDTSALLKRYVAEADSGVAQQLLASDTLITSRITVVEVRRNLARLVSAAEMTLARSMFAADLRSIDVIEVDEGVCDLAAELGEVTGVRTLDAIHLASARRVGGTLMPFITFDVAQAQAARSLGMAVLGA